jgi:DNA-binding MarR family transcriptional regulator
MADSHCDLIMLIDATARLHGRLRSAFATVRTESGLSEMEQTVLSAVTEARTPPIVAQIGRSLGHPRQVIQRAANALAEAGLIAFVDNPDHKRAQLLAATAEGKALQAQSNARAEAVATRLLRDVNPQQVRDANALLATIRSALEKHEREAGQ